MAIYINRVWDTARSELVVWPSTGSPDIAGALYPYTFGNATGFAVAEVIPDDVNTDDDAIHDNVASEIAALTEKASPVSGDLLMIEDSAAGNAKKKVQIGNLPGAADPNAVHVNASGEIAGVTSKGTLVAGDLLLIEDSAAANAKKSAAVSALRITESQITDLDHTDANAFHDNVSGEIAALTAATLSGSDHVLIEDADDSNNKKRVLASEFFGSGSDPDAIHDNVADEFSGTGLKASPVSADRILIEDSEDSFNKAYVEVSSIGSGGSGGPTPAEPTWADEYWDIGDATFDGSDVLVSWPSVPATTTLTGTATRKPSASVPANSAVAFSERWGAIQPALDLRGTKTASGTLGSSIAASSDLYVAVYGMAYALSASVLRGFACLNGGLGIFTRGDQCGMVWQVAATGADQLIGVVLDAGYPKIPHYPALWEIIHRVGTSIEFWVDGRRLINNEVTQVGAREAASTIVSLSGNPMAHTSLGANGDGYLNGLIVHEGIPTLEQRAGAAAWFASL